MKTLAPTPAALSPRLHSRAVLVLTGLSYLFVGLGFSYLDRQFRSFGIESLLWLVWTLLGFGAGALHVNKPGSHGHTLWTVLGTTGFVLALFPGFALYAFPRWIGMVLMVIMGARAAVLSTQRDFYLTLTVVFTVSFMVATHSRADWSLWFYLGPAWVLGGLALAWEHASGTRLSRWTRLSMTLGFIGVTFALTAVLFLFAPRPSILGFGFLPPGTDTPGMFPQAAGEGGTQPARGSGGALGGRASGMGQGGAGAVHQGSWAQQWGAMLGGMRTTLTDPFIPQWQRGLIESLLDGAQALLHSLAGGSGQASDGAAGTGQELQPAPEPYFITIHWLRWLVLLFAAWLLWRRRHRIGLALALAGSWLLAGRFPAQSMRLSAQAITWCLQVHGHPKDPGQSVREHWGAASTPPLARRWMGQALEIYCETRFGGLAASPQRARRMREAAQGACDIILGRAPELAR